MNSSLTIAFRRLAVDADGASARAIAVSLCPNENEEPDEVLIGLVQICDNDAMSQLFRRYAGSVRTVGLRILRDTGEADDLVQEVFLYIYQRSRVFDGSKGSARSWIFQVAYTQALLRRRRLKSHGFYASVITDRPTESGLPCAKGAHFDNTVESCFGKDGWNAPGRTRRRACGTHSYDCRQGVYRSPFHGRRGIQLASTSERQGRHCHHQPHGRCRAALVPSGGT